MLTRNEIKYLNTIPKDKKVRILPYDLKVKETVGVLISEIKKILPNLEVKSLGTSTLGIAGKNDIDLYIFSPIKDFPKYLPKLKKLYSEPVDLNDNSIKWEFTKDGYEVELYLTDPKSASTKRQIDVFSILSKDKKLLREYEKIKLSCNGKSAQEYQKKKYEFYNRILGK